MDQQDTAALFDRYLSGNCTPEEEQLVEDWYLHTFLHRPDPQLPSSREDLKAAIWKKVEQRTRPGRSGLLQAWRYAAAFALIILAAGMYFSGRLDKTAVQPQIVQDVKPGGTAAVLTLANGRKIDLENTGNGKIASQPGAIVSKTKTGELVYQADDAEKATKEHNIIATPPGGQYKITLPDGSQVWLNAASSISFSPSFREHEVELAGEAYFEVRAKAGHPFAVLTSNQRITVMGTRFNVNDYTEDRISETVLVSGAVKIAQRGNMREVILRPGQQAVLSGGVMNVREADIEVATAWKNGRIMFRDAELPAIMRQVSRWYNVEVVYEGRLPKRKFTGGISRSSSLSALLEILRLSNIQCTVSEGPGGVKLIVKGA